MRKIVAFVVAVAGLSPLPLQAQMVKFDVVERVPAFAGRSFGEVGAYERITATPPSRSTPPTTATL